MEDAVSSGAESTAHTLPRESTTSNRFALRTSGTGEAFAFPAA